jgi:hypothetical protein
MSVLIKGMKKPDNCEVCPYAFCHLDTRNCPIVDLPDHGDLIDRDAFRKTMYHDAFETDSDLQKWESGCWIRYKMFERMVETAPTIIPASEEGE